jgi:hypothetical protein
MRIRVIEYCQDVFICFQFYDNHLYYIIYRIYRMNDTYNTPLQTTLIYPSIADTSYNQYTNVLLIDNAVSSYQTFVDSTNAYTFPIVYSKDCSGTQLMELLRNRFSSFSRIGFVFTSQGNQSVTFLDNQPLFTDNYNEPYSTNLELIVAMIREFSVINVDFLACDTLKYPNWKTYYEFLTQSTGVIVGASDDKTGNIKYGGDWILESTSEDIETIYFTQSIEYYQYLLDNLTWYNGITNILTLATDGTYIYTGGDNNILRRVHIATRVLDPNWRTPVTYQTYGMSAYNGNIYLANRGVGSITRISIADPSNNVTTSWFTYNSSVYGNPTDCRVNGNFLYLGVSSTILRYDLTAGQGATATVFATSTQGVAGGTAISIAFDTSFAYVSSYDTEVIARISLISPSTVYTTNFCTGLAAGLSSLVHSNGYLYMSKQVSPVRYARIKVSNTSDADYNIAPTVTAQYVRGAVAAGDYVYMGYSNGIIQFDVPIPPYIPYSTVSIDAGNTIAVASGNLRVQIVDPSNTPQNNVYYQYALNSFANASFANTFVRANVSPYTFFIPSITDISNTIYVRASNSVGNSSAANLQVLVYRTPRSPPQVNYQLVGSGNVQVTIVETAVTPISYYYLNNVSYHLYAYNTFGGTNLSGNTSTLVYNRPVGVLSNTNSTYSPVVSYINTGLNANTYTMYVVARNTVGNSTPVSANITVLTTPVSPTIDTVNTQSTTSGNLTVFITDTVNSSTNGVYYLYSMDGINYGNSGVAKTSATTYQFTINNTGNAQVPLTAGTYTLRVAATNSVGNSISSPATATEIVYTTPISPSIDTVNTQSTTSGNLTVFITDTVNNPVNGVYYLYSMNGINYGNSGVAKTSATTYQFTINNTGNAQVPLTAGTYTLRVAATNPIGNTISSPATATEIVYTTPLAPIINTGNTKSITSGNVNVAFTDPSNTANNSIEYIYFMYDPSAASLFYV